MFSSLFNHKKPAFGPPSAGRQNEVRADGSARPRRAPRQARGSTEQSRGARSSRSPQVFSQVLWQFLEATGPKGRIKGANKGNIFYLLLHLEAALRNPFSPLIKANFFVRDHLFICASRLEAELRSGCSSE